MSISLANRQDVNEGLLPIQARVVSQKVLEYIKSVQIHASITTIFEHTFNIETQERFLINIGTDNLPLTPRSILLSNEDFYNVLLPKLHVNLFALCSKGSIYFPALKMGISTSHAVPFNPRVKLSGDLMPDRIMKRNLIEALARGVGEGRSIRGMFHSPLSGYFISRFSFIDDSKLTDGRRECFPSSENDFLTPLVKMLWERIDFLLCALTENCPKDVSAAVRDILGFGPGLTPSGDDFLAGFTSAAILLVDLRQNSDKGIKKMVETLSQEAAGRTTCISLSMIEDAIKGETSELAIDFIQSVLHTEDTERIRYLADQMSSIGGTSGEDYLNGIATGIWFFKKKASQMALK